MHFEFERDTPLLDTMVGGKSVLDSPKLYIKTKDEAYAFVKSYGFDLHQESEVQKLWGYHRRALVFMQEKLLNEGEIIPELLADPKQLSDLRELLLMASRGESEHQELRKWACALLRVMHIFIHSEKDLFSYYAADIQKQILSPIQECVVHESDRIILKHPFDKNEIPLVNFEIKPFKTASSSAIKLLAKPDVVALKVLDKVGVRFVTHSLFDAFRVALFLAENNLINYAHVMPDQSSNTLFPLDLLKQVLHDSTKNGESQFDPEKVNKLMTEIVRKAEGGKKILNFIRKENFFSHHKYAFLKFIGRKLITLNAGVDNEPFRFFYPFEVQIVDIYSHQRNEAGSASHKEYKERQKIAARARVFQAQDGK